METTPESPAPSTEALAELEVEFTRLETELAALDDADETPPAQNPPAQNPPAQNPPAQNPPAQNPPAQNPDGGEG